MEDFIVEAVESTRGPLAIQIKRTRSPPIRDAKVNGAEWQGRGRKLTAFPKRTSIDNQTNSPPLYETIERKELDKHRASFAATFPFATS